MTARRGLFVNIDGSSNGTAPSDARLGIASVVADDGTSALAGRNGVFYDGQGNVVSGNTDTGTMSYSVRACQFALYLLGTVGSGIVLGSNDAVFKATTTAAPGSNSRIDVIWVRQHAVASGDGGSDSDNIMQIGVTQGTAAASPTVPTIPTGAMALAQAVMTSGSTSTNSLAITQVHGWTTTHGSAIPVRTQAERDALTGFNGLSVYRIDQQNVETHNGTAWNAGHKPRRLLTRLATYALATGVNTAVGSWTADTGDDGDGNLTYSNPTVVVNRAGLYYIRFLTLFPASATGVRTLGIYRNATLSGGTITAGTASALETIAGQASSHTVDVECLVQCAVGDTLVAAASQTSGGSLTCGSTTQGFDLWQIIQLDPS